MQHLTTDQLAKRWGIASNTIRRWRTEGTGPAFVKLGEGIRSAVRYKLEDIEAYEAANYYTKEQQ